MMRLARWGLLCTVLLALPAWSMSASPLKTASDQAGNYLVDQYNLGTGTFGKSKYRNLPGFNALVVEALCSSRRKYREGIGPFISEPVKRMLKLQREDGAISLEGMGLEAYNTALFVMALKATDNPAHQEAIEKAKKYLLKCQNKDGGFCYDHTCKGGGDLSNTWITLDALAAAGLDKDSAAFKNAVKFIRRCQDNAETNPEMQGTTTTSSGGAYYKPGGSAVGTVTTREGRTVPKPYGTMTAAMIESLLICKMKPEAPEIQAALRWFKENYDVKRNPGAGQKGYFYYVLAFCKAMSALGVKEIELPNGKKVNWAADMGSHLLSIQNKDGSFVNIEPKWMEDDPVLCTAYAQKALTLCIKALK